MAELRAGAEARAERRPHELYDKQPDFDDNFEHGWLEGDAEAYRQISNGWINWPLALLPEGARAISFADLAMELSMHPRGFTLLTGADRAAAGLENFRMSNWGDHIGAAFSFCANNKTYTAFENPSDDYRSSMGFLIERDGNHCRNVFEPCALLPQFCRSRDWAAEDDADPSDPHDWRRVPPADKRAGHADILELINPKTGSPALSVGTRRSDDYYPSFVGHVDPPTLQTAQSLGIAESFAFADELVSTIPLSTPPRKFRL